MGKAALILVLGVTIALVGLYANQVDSGLARTDEQSTYEESVLARELARSAFNIAYARTAGDFNNYRGSARERVYGDGYFEYAATGDTGADVRVQALGHVGRSDYTISVTLTRTGEPLLDALTLDGPVNQVNASGNSFLITGVDTNPPGVVTEPVGNTHAVRTILPEAGPILTSSIDAGQMTGVGGTGDLVTGPVNSKVDLDALATAILSWPERIVLTGKQKMKGNQTFGSRQNPIVLVVDGDLDIDGNVEGYGVLYVNGKLRMAGTPRWEGLVYVSNPGGKHEFKGTADIFGAVIIRTVTDTGESGGTPDRGLPGGHFDVDVFDGATTSETYHEHQYDDKYDLTYVDLLSSGCTNSGLCWNDILASRGYTSVRAEFFNEGSSSGSYVFRANAVQVSGSPSQGFNRVFNPGDLTQFRVTFDDLCTLRGTQPGKVQSDMTTRDNAFSVRIYDATGPGTNLIYELSVYHHIKGGECDPGQGGNGSPGTPSHVKPMDLTINGQAHIQYSSAALTGLPLGLPSLKPLPSVIKIVDSKERAYRGETLIQLTGLQY